MKKQSQYTFWDEMWNVPPKSENELNKEEDTAQEEWFLSRKFHQMSRFDKVLSLHGEETQDITA